jgi:hypothetical protein
VAPGGVEIAKQPLIYDEEVDRAVAGLDASGRSRRLFTYATVQPSAIHAATELASAELVAGKWSAGGDVEFTITRATGSVVTSGKTRIEPGTRSAALDIPLRDAQGQPVDVSAAPFHVSVHVSSRSEAVDDGVDAVSGGRLVGDPEISRAASGPRAALRPAAEFRFLGTERIHIEWPVKEVIDQRHVRLLRRTGEPLPYVPTITERDADGRRVIAVDFLLSPLAEGEYAMELTVQNGATDAERKLVAFRVAR